MSIPYEIWGVPWYKAIILLFGDNILLFLGGFFLGRLLSRKKSKESGSEGEEENLPTSDNTLQED